MNTQDFPIVTPFDNYVGISPLPNIASDNFTPILQNTTLTFAVYGGRTTLHYPATLLSQQTICHVTESPNITSEVLDETTSVEVGKQDYMSNRGYRFTYAITVNGNAIAGVAKILGYEFGTHASSPYGFLQSATMPTKGRYGIMGNMIIHSGNKAGKISSSILLTQCKIIHTEVSTTGTYILTFESEGRLIKSTNGAICAFENFYDNQNIGGDIVNAFAPDGSITVFKVGNGNHSLPAAGVLPLTGGLPLCPIDSTKTPFGVAPETITDPFYWFAEICVNGVPLEQDEVVSYDYATGELTLAVAPADGASLSLTYFLPSGANNFVDNKRYYVGAVVRYNGSYYKCNTAYAGAWIAGNWDLLSDTNVGGSYIPHYYGKGSDINNLQYPTCFRNSWTLFNLNM